MPLFDRRSEDEKAAELTAKTKADKVRAEAKAVADEQREVARAAARYAESEPGKAAAAKARGDGFFEAALAVLDLKGQSSFGETSASISRRGPNGAVLGEIEALGWRLEHASYVFLETASVSTNRLLVTGEGTAVRGVLTGLYLFRNTGSEA